MPPSYGISKAEEGMLSWEHVTDLLQNALNYWIATTTKDGRPHVRPVWGAWVEDTLYFDGSPETGWGRNILRDPHISVQVDAVDDVVMVEGVVVKVPKADEELVQKLLASCRAKYMPKYNYDHEMEADGWRERGMFSLKPTKILAWSVPSFGVSPTRWLFDQPKPEEK
jgi:nitroimidazol reductase NimA-like FMN-containing flavoprotein (pyridoxamine 5'-phosphate oxidase superfamily)